MHNPPVEIASAGRREGQRGGWGSEGGEEEGCEEADCFVAGFGFAGECAGLVPNGKGRGGVGDVGDESADGCGGLGEVWGCLSESEG